MHRIRALRLVFALTGIALANPFAAGADGAHPTNAATGLTPIYGQWNLEVAGRFTPWAINSREVFDGRCHWKYQVVASSEKPGRETELFTVDLYLYGPTPRANCTSLREDYLELSFVSTDIRQDRVNFGMLIECFSRERFDLYKSDPENASCSRIAMQRAALTAPLD